MFQTFVTIVTGSGAQEAMAAKAVENYAAGEKLHSPCEQTRIVHY